MADPLAAGLGAASSSVIMTSLVGGVVLFLIAQPLLLAVFADQLSERVERDVLGTAATVPFFTSMGKAMVHGLLKLVLYGIALVVGAGLTAVDRRHRQLIIGLALGGLSLAYDGFDYPLARRSASFGAKWALPRAPSRPDDGLRHRRDWVFYLIPFVVFVARPSRRGCDVGVHRHREKEGRLPAAPAGAETGGGKAQM